MGTSDTAGHPGPAADIIPMHTPAWSRPFRAWSPVAAGSVLVVLACSLLPRAQAQQSPPIGVNLNNLWQVGTLTQEYAVIDRAYQAGARLARLSLGDTASEVTASESHMAHCASIGMDVSLTLTLGNASFYPTGTQKVSTVNYGASYRLSDLDVNLFDTWVQGMLHDLNTAGVVPRYIELGNEIGWIDFNGDLPEVTGGKQFDSTTSWSDSQYVTIRTGLDKYGQALARLRTDCANEFGAGKVRISVAGLNYWSDTLPQGIKDNNGSAMKPDLLLQLLQGTNPNQSGATNYLADADEIALHPQPSTDDTLSDFAALQAIDTDLEDKVGKIQSALPSNSLMPLRFSEWFLRSTDFRDVTDPEWERLRRHHMILKSMARMTDVNWEGSTYYTFVWDTDNNNLYDLASDTVLRSADVLQETPYNELRNGTFDGNLAYWTVSAGTANIYTNTTLGNTCGLTPSAATEVYQDYTYVQAGDMLQLKCQARLANSADTASLTAWVQDASGTTLLTQSFTISGTSYEPYSTAAFVAPTGAARVRVRMYRPAGSGNCYFDSIQLLVHPNLLLNNDYSDGLNHWSSDNSGASVVTGFGSWNQNVVRVQSTTSGGQTSGDVYQTVSSLVAGKNYRLVGWARATDVSGSASPAFVVKFRSGSSVLATTTVPITSTNYQFYMSGSLAAPSGTDNVVVYLSQGNTTGLIYARDLALYPYTQP